MSLLHKAITLSGACAIGLTLAFAAPAAADDAKPINFRAVGGAVLGGTWNVGLTGVGKLVNDRYPGSAINVLQGASVSNPLRLEQNAADVTLTQTSNRARAVFDRRLIAFKRLRIFAVFVRFSRRFGCLTSQCGWAACLLIRLFGAFPRLGRMHPFRNAPVITSAPVFMRPAVIFLTLYSLRQSVVFLPAATICRPPAVC